MHDHFEINSHPGFFLWHSDLRLQIQEWIDKIENTTMGIRPIAVLDGIKTGKSSILQFAIPKVMLDNKILKSSAHVVYFDFSTAAEHHFFQDAYEYHLKFAKSLYSDIENDFVVSSLWENTLSNLLEALDYKCRNDNVNILYAWDEIQSWMQQSDGKTILDRISFKNQCKNSYFAVTGTWTFTLYDQLYNMSSSGRHFLSTSTVVVTRDDAYLSKTHTRMIELMLKYSPNCTPSDLSLYLCDTHPATVAFFCFEHGSINNTPKELKKTSRNVMQKMKSCFEKDLAPRLKRLEKDQLAIVLKIAHSLCSVDEEFESMEYLDFNGKLVRIALEDVLDCEFYLALKSVVSNRDGKAFIKGFYGILICRFISASGNFLTKAKFNPSIPIPQSFSTYQLAYETTILAGSETEVNKNKRYKGYFEKYGIDLASKKMVDLRVLQNNTFPQNPLLLNNEDTKYLDAVKLIRHTCTHAKTIIEQREITQLIPEKYFEVCRFIILYNIDRE